MSRLLMTAAISTALVMSAACADAASSRRPMGHTGHHARMWYAPVGLQGGHAYAGGHAGYGYGAHGPYVAGPAWRPVGPPWAGPNQCFVDLGYGRYETCDLW